MNNKLNITINYKRHEVDSPSSCTNLGAIDNPHSTPNIQLSINLTSSTHYWQSIVQLESLEVPLKNAFSSDFRKGL